MKLSQAKLLAKVIPYYQKLFNNAASYVNALPDVLFCWIGQDGQITESKSTICYSGLSANMLGNKLLSVGARLLYDLKNHFVAVKNISISNEEIENYITYVIERSPFKDAFLNKQAKSVIKHRWMFMDVSQPANYMVSALVAIRYTHEFPNLVKAWNELVKVGVNEDLAWLIIHICYYNPNSKKVSFYAHAHGHTVLSSSLPLDQVKNFLNRKFVNAKPPYIKDARYAGFDALWSRKFTFDYPYEYEYGSVSKDVISIISKSVVGSSKGTNPFAASSSSEIVSVPLKEFPEFILGIQDKIMEEVNNA